MMTFRRMLSVMIAGLLLSVAADAGQLDAPAPPSDAASDMITLQELYDYLTTGAAPGAPGAFQEPAAGPTVGTMHTLQEMYVAIKALFDQSTVTAANVLSGRKYFSTLPWGIQTGTMPNRGAVTITPGTTAVTITQGYHDGTGSVAGDTDLAAGNIKSGVEIFGVTGTYTGVTCSGTLSSGGRWCDNLDGTVTDMTTGIVWLKKADWGGKKPWRNFETSYPAMYDDAHQRAGLLYAGASGANLNDGSVVGDWRLPTKSELKGLVTGSEAVSSSNMYAFTGVQSDYYWSSTTNADFTDVVWGVDLYDGDVYSTYKSHSYYVWPVRGGE